MTSLPLETTVPILNMHVSKGGEKDMELRFDLLMLCEVFHIYAERMELG